MEAVILASGLGIRLREATGGIPKCFYEVLGYPLMAYPIISLKKIGIKRLVLIVPEGFEDMAKKIVDRFEMSGTIVENREIYKGNAHSLLLSEAHLQGERFIVSCCDSLYPPSAPGTLIESKLKGDVLVGVSKIDQYIEKREASKVRVSENKVIKIGKRLRRYDFFDTGLFLMSRDIYRVKRDIKWSKEMHLYEMLQLAIKRGLGVLPVDLGGVPWTEIDTEGDLEDILNGSRRNIVEEILKWKV